MRRFILLGASNLTMALPRVVDGIESAYAEEPLRVFAALGHGRSYGWWSSVLGRALPGITECGLWEALAADEADGERPRETLGLITDVGNDLLYGAEVSRIAGWIHTCLERVSQYNAEVVLTLLPMGTIERLSAWRYYAARSIFFPGNRISWPRTRQRACELHAALDELGREHAVHIIEQPQSWYGFDPIHIRHTKRATAWARILAGWSSFPNDTPVVRGSLSTRWRMLSAQPAERRVLGRRRLTAQPALRNGRTTVSLY